MLLHGFPEFWFALAQQIDALAAAGFRVVAPDMRGYNLSSKPAGVAAYALPLLAADVRDLIDERGGGRRRAARRPRLGRRWSPGRRRRTTRRRSSAWRSSTCRIRSGCSRGCGPRSSSRKSWYILAFQLPWLPERLLRLRRFEALRRPLEHDARAGAFSPADIDRYVEAWSQPGALTRDARLLPRDDPRPAAP